MAVCEADQQTLKHSLNQSEKKWIRTDVELMRYRRGKTTILNRPGLERVACECYQPLKESFDHFLDD